MRKNDMADHGAMSSICEWPENGADGKVSEWRASPPVAVLDSALAAACALVLCGLAMVFGDTLRLPWWMAPVLAVLGETPMTVPEPVGTRGDARISPHACCVSSEVNCSSGPAIHVRCEAEVEADGEVGSLRSMRACGGGDALSPDLLVPVRLRSPILHASVRPHTLGSCTYDGRPGFLYPLSKVHGSRDRTHATQRECGLGSGSPGTGAHLTYLSVGSFWDNCTYLLAPAGVA